MSSTWIIVADVGRARILSPQVGDRKPLEDVVHFVGRAGYVGPEKLQDERLEEIDTLINPSGRLKRQDLDTDRPGRVKSPGVAESYEPTHKDLHHQKAEEFARRLVAYLAHARHEHRFEHLVLVAPPMFLGELRKKLPRDLNDLVTLEIDRDYSNLSLQEIRGHLPEELWLSAS